MSCDRRAYLASLAFDAKARGEGQEFVSYLVAQIRDRLDRGRSMDCDEYRTLLKLAGRTT